MKKKNFLVLIYQNDEYHYDEATGMPTGTTTKKTFFPVSAKWVKATHADEAVGILYKQNYNLFLESDHYACYSGWRAYIRAVIFFPRFL